MNRVRNTKTLASAECRAGRLQAIMGAGRLEAHFQPKFSLRGELVGVEALARWVRPSGELVMPGELLPRCHAAGGGLFLDAEIASQAIQFASSSRAHDGGAITVAINLDPDRMLDGVFMSWLDECVDRHDLPRSQVTIEVLEVSIDDPDGQLRVAIEGMQARGFRFSIDDFGTGQSGLQRLLDTPVDELKVAGCLVDGVSQDKRKAIIVEGAMAMARRLDMTVVLEGLECAHDIGWFHRHGWSGVQAQGYGLARPMSPASIRAWMS